MPSLAAPPYKRNEKAKSIVFFTHETRSENVLVVFGEPAVETKMFADGIIETKWGTKRKYEEGE